VVALRCGKIMLPRLPIDCAFWKKLGLFEHGDMNQPTRALETYLMYAQPAGLPTPPQSPGVHFIVLELGPGDSVFTAMSAKGMGVEQGWLEDEGPLARTDPAVYSDMAAYLQARECPVPMAQPIESMDDVLNKCNGVYLTNGDASLAQMPNLSVEYCLFNAELEYIPKCVFLHLAIELRRRLKPGGVCVHRLDLKDHLGGGLNNSRFSERAWEGALFSQSGFYTNRIRFSEMLDIFHKAGFEFTFPRNVVWAELPISRSAFEEEFQTMPDDDLLVSGFDNV
jgi:hypothetical protein